MELKTLDALPSAHVIEAAVAALCPALDIDDPQQAATRLVDLGGQHLDPSSVDDMLRKAGEEATDDVAELLRLVLAAQGGSAVASEPLVSRAVDMAGRKQMVITPDHLYMAALLAACCIAVLRNPKLSEEERVSIEDAPDGRKKVTIDRKVKYFSPFSPLVALVENVVKRLGKP